MAHAIEKRLDRLATTGPFRRCTRRELHRVAAAVDEVDLVAGEMLCEQGDADRGCFVVVAGRVSVRVDGDEIAVLGSGEVIGEMAALDRHARSATVVAIEAVTAYAIPAAAMPGLLVDVPLLAVELMETLSDRLRRTDRPATAGSA